MGCSERGLGGAFGVALLLYSTCLIIVMPVGVGGNLWDYANKDVFCAQVGQNSEWGPYTIGGELNRMIDRTPLRVLSVFTKATPDWLMGFKDGNLTCDSDPSGYKHDWQITKFSFVDFCPKDVEIRAYLVKQHGRVLKGWLHFEVEIKNDEMEYILIQARDENHNFVGEFVTEKDEQCSMPASKDYLVPPTKYQVLPCSAIGSNEAKVANSIFMAKPEAMEKGDELKNRKGFFPHRPITKGVHFNWRLDEYWCNRHTRIRLEANVWSKKTRDNWSNRIDRAEDDGNLIYQRCDNQNKDCRIKRKTTAFWIYPKWIGAAEIKLPGELDCSIPAIDYESTDTDGRLAKNSWIQKASLLKFGENFLARPPAKPFGATPGCQLQPWPSSLMSDFLKIPSFGGRCKSTNDTEKKPSKELHHSCPTTSTEIQQVTTVKFTPYNEYYQNLIKSRVLQCSQECREPNISDPKDLANIQSFPRGNRSEAHKNRKPKIVFDTLLKSRHGIRATTFWQTRKFHGGLCIFLTLFLIPISNFFIRYYKETFMHSHGLGCAPWFWFHLFVCFAVPTLLWCSYSAMSQNINTFGRSTSSEAVFHRVLGRVFVTGFFLMVCLGGIRPVPTRLRLVCMALHSVVGFILYILAIILIINSTFIPSSPSVHGCDEDKGLPIGVSFTAIMAFVWLVIDLLFHALLTFLQFMLDRKYEIKRAGFGLPFVPILPAISPYSRADLVGSRFRKVLLFLYVIIAAIITFLTIAQLFQHELIEHCVLGNLTCDLRETMPNKTSSPFGCSAFALKYYAKFYDKYIVASEPGAKLTNY